MNLNVQLDRWIIEDGNYDDFREGETRQFALEYCASSALRKSKIVEKRLFEAEDYKYQVVAEVVFASEEIVVLDFGLLAYSQSASNIQAGYGAGDFVQGEVFLGVDPFFCFEWHSKLAGVPPMIYEWFINSIEQDTTPLVLLQGSERMYVRDETRRCYGSVNGTNQNIASQLIPSSPYYVLHCTWLNTTPRKALNESG